MIGPLTNRQNAPEDPSAIVSIDNHNEEETLTEKSSLPLVPAEYGSRSITLNYLLDFAIQFTYHEFGILTELLQKKSEADRKISLAHFTRSTRLIFLKLFAIVKWIKKSKKFEQLDSISFFLDQQSGYFVETADRFVQIARTELVFAGFPLYQIDKAINILSKGSYVHLPQTIKKRYIKEGVCNTRQKSFTLRWLNNRIQYQLTQETVPTGITRIEIKNGMAIFTTPNEFVVKMTVSPVVSGQIFEIEVLDVEEWHWTVLDVDILVNDYEIGVGSNLVHPVQKIPLVALCQAQITHSQNDIENIYNVLHEFCMKLQLDIFFCQVEQLSSTVSRAYVRVERYDPYKGVLVIKYWAKSRHSSSYLIEIEKNPISRAGLKLNHYPFNIKLPVFPFNSVPNFHQIFNRTIRLRCQEHLQQVRQIFSDQLSSTSHISHVQDDIQSDQYLLYQLLPVNDLNVDEYLKILIDTFSGRPRLYLKTLDNASASLVELEKLINNDLHLNPTSFRRCLQNLQTQLLIKRYREAVDKSRMHEIAAKNFPVSDKLKELSEDTICLQLIFEPRIYLVISLYFENEYDVRTQIINFNFNGLTFKTTQIDIMEYIAAENATILNQNQMKQLLSLIADKSLFDEMSTVFRVDVEKNVTGNNFHSIKLKGSDLPSSTEFGYPLDEFVEFIVHQSTDPYTWTLECALKESLPCSHSTRCISDNRVQSYIEELPPNHRKTLSTGYALGNQIKEILRGCSQLHEIFKSFIVVYDYYFKQECTITYCGYNRICIAYGETRNNVLSILYKPKSKNFVLSFIPTAQADPKNPTNKVLPTTFSNPHQFMYSVLTERFNKDHNLINLTQHLTNTHLTCLPIFYFTQQRLRSVKACSQMVGVDEKNFFVEMQTLIQVVSPTQIRITYGVVHVEFYLLPANRVIIESSAVLNRRRHILENVPLFLEFWHFHSKGGVVIAQKANTSFLGSSFVKHEDFYLESPSPSTPRSDCVSTPTPATNLDNISPSSQRPIPAKMSQIETPPKPDAVKTYTRRSLILDSSALQHGMMIKNNDNYASSLDEYLHAINFFFSVGSSISHMAKEKKKSFPLIDIRFGLDFVEMFAIGLSHPAITAADPWNVRIHLYLCNQTFVPRCSLNFSGSCIPDVKFIQIFERYFETRIIPQYNEMEVLSFVVACRVMADGVFESIARIMELEMELNVTNVIVKESHWKIGLLLSVLSPTPSNEKLISQAPSRKFITSLMINESCKHLLITLSIRSNRSNRPDSVKKKVVKRVELVYILPTNSMTTRNVFTGQRASETDKKSVEELMLEVNKMESSECRIWPAIQCLLTRYNP